SHFQLPPRMASRADLSSSADFADPAPISLRLALGCQLILVNRGDGGDAGAVAILAAPSAVSQRAVAAEKFCPTGLGENAKRVEPAALNQVPHLGKGHVWPQIRIHN